MSRAGSTTRGRRAVRHVGLDGNAAFMRLLGDPLRYGAYFTRSEDGSTTTAYVGVPGHELRGQDLATASEATAE